MHYRQTAGPVVASCLLFCSIVPAAGTFESALRPTVITAPQPIFYPNALSDPITGQKPGFASSVNPNQPLHNQWLISEHAMVQTGPDRWLLVSMEQNWNLLQYGAWPWVEAFNFVQWGTGFPETPQLPQAEKGYWRGATLDTHSHVWAPSVFEEDGVWYLFYPARIPDTIGGKLYPFLATSSTGNAEPSEWIPFDPDTGTAEVEPLFEVDTAAGGRDFMIVKVPTQSGHEYRMYYTVDVMDADLGFEVNEVWMRTSSSLTDWSTDNDIVVFDHVNVGETIPQRYRTDYENPYVVRHDNGDYYLFLSRHGLLPADFGQTGWEIIPYATEVFWSADGLFFEEAHQLPDLERLDGKAINSSEILRSGDRWFATDAANSNNPNHWPFNACETSPGSGVFTCFDELWTQLLDYWDAPSHQLRLVEFEWQVPAGLEEWVLY